MPPTPAGLTVFWSGARKRSLTMSLAYMVAVRTKSVYSACICRSAAIVARFLQSNNINATDFHYGTRKEKEKSSASSTRTSERYGDVVVAAAVGDDAVVERLEDVVPPLD